MPEAGKVDLHTHSTCSDGRLTPRELVRMAHRNGVRRLALTDHDTTAGLVEAIAAAESLGVEIIPGIEFGTDIPGNEVHVLGLFVRHQDPRVQRALTLFQEGRVDRARGMVDKLAALGFPIAWERVQEIAQGSVGRPHVAQALLEAGHVQTMAEAFDRFIGRNGPAYVERVKFTPEQAIELIHRVGGVAVMAHPREGKGTLQVLDGLVAAGLDGLECFYYREYAPGSVQELLELAQRHGLVATGGSDYHGFTMSGLDSPSNEPGTVTIPADCVDQLLERRDRLGL
jgi:predicted metal-dependent phosphoesterase TrpH